MGKESKKGKQGSRPSSGARWQTVEVAGESLRFIESAGFVSLEECQQELYDPSNPPPVFVADVEEPAERDEPEAEPSAQLAEAQAEIDRLMRENAARPSAQDAKMKKKNQKAEAGAAALDGSGMEGAQGAKQGKNSKRKRAQAAVLVEDESDAEVEEDSEVNPAEDGNNDAAPPKKKRTRQKKKKKKAQGNSKEQSKEETEGVECGADVEQPADGHAIGAQPVALADRERSGASMRELSESERTAATINWERLGLHHSIVSGLVAQGFCAPTPIQEAALPPALHGMRDLVGAAETGSGKTLAFGLPILHRLVEDVEAANAAMHGEEDSLADADDHDDFVPNDTTQVGRLALGGHLFALIMTPTRELATQLATHLQAVAAACPALPKGAIVTLVGGLSLEKQRRLIDKKPAIVVATPGRLWELISDGSEHLQDLSALRFFVLDEVDRMIETGHFQEVSRILELLGQIPRATSTGPDARNLNTRPRQTFLFSATLMLPPAAREAHAKKIKNHKPVPEGSATDTLLRTIPFLNSIKLVDLSRPTAVATKLSQTKLSCLAEEKDAALALLLSSHAGRAIVFCNAVTAVTRLRSILSLLRLSPIALQGGMQQRARLKALERFRGTPNAILLATDVAARGLDIRGIDYVVHYQLPRSAEVYVHRSGRTARAAASGLSVAMVAPADAKNFRRLCLELNTPDGMEEYSLPAKQLPKAIEALRLARRVDRAEHSQQRKAKEVASMRRMAEAMDLALSDEEEEEEQTHSNGRRQTTQIELARDRAQLDAMLTKMGWKERGKTSDELEVDPTC